MMKSLRNNLHRNNLINKYNSLSNNSFLTSQVFQASLFKNNSRKKWKNKNGFLSFKKSRQLPRKKGSKSRPLKTKRKMKNLALRRNNPVIETDKDRTNRTTMMTSSLKLP